MLPTIAQALGVLVLFAGWNSAHADTYYVRMDGGDASQCTGRNDAPYPGTGTAEACAWNHPFQALAPDGTRRILGGDTLRIAGGSYRIGQGAPGAGACLPANCSLATVPGGSPGARTRILGDPANPARLWGAAGVTRVLSLDTSSYVEVGHLEITDQDDCIYNHSNAAVKCAAVGSGNWGKHGIYARASTGVWLHDLDIHGLGHTGLWAGGLTDWTMERVRLHRNGRAGWDANIGTGSSNAGAIVLRGMEIAWNGCGERWQTGEAWACWGQQAGGYGDGVGTVATGGQWLVEDTFIHHNTQDGLDLRFLDGADGTHATVRRVLAVGNAGNQVKVRGNSLIENSVLIGSCGYFNGRDFMLAADQCRADGTTLLLVFTPNDNAVVRHNTITGQGWSLVGATEGDSSGRALVQNNVLVGFPWFLNPADLSRVQAGTSPAIVTHLGNLVWSVYANACPGDSLCGQSPRLANMTLASFDGQPLPDSPVVDRVPPMAAVATDFLLNPRPRGTASDMGAYEIEPPPTCQRGTPALSLSGSTAAVAPGTSLQYTLVLASHDSAACAPTTYSLAQAVPTGWSSSLEVSELTVTAGGTGSTKLTVTSPDDAGAGEHPVGVGAASGVGTVHTATAGTLYTVQPPPSCAPAAPTLELQGGTVAVPAGTGIDYTLVVTNNDSGACATTAFSLADTVPAGWSGAMVQSQLNLAPGGTGSTTLTVASPVDAAPGGYAIGAGTSSGDSMHTTSASATYTVQEPPPPCTRHVPSLQLTGPTAPVAAGTSVTYTIGLANHDSASCTSTTFNLADSVPVGWTGTLALSQLTLAPGESGATTLTVTSAGDAVEGAYGLGAGAASNVGAEHTVDASATYTVAPVAPTCIRAAPGVEIAGPAAPVQAGTAVAYTVEVRNNDSAGCASTDFSLTHTAPAGWTGTLDDDTLASAPGSARSVELAVTSPANATAGDYVFGVGVGSTVGAVHTAAASATYTVAVPPPVCTRATPQVSLTGSTAAVDAGTAVTYTLSVSNQDSAACATTTFDLDGSVPPGWIGTLAAQSLSLAPGTSANTMLNVTSAPGTSEGPYTVGAGIGSDAGAVHTANATIVYTVSPPTPTCTRAAPVVSLAGTTGAVSAGTAVAYTLGVSNQDSAACTSTSFALAGSVPVGWIGTLGMQNLSLAPGASASTTLTVTSASGAPAGPYTVGANVVSTAGAVHSANASIIYTVAPPPPQCTRAAPTLTLAGPTAAVAAGVPIDYSVGLVNNDSAACPGTAFNLTRTVPAGWSGTLTTASLTLAPGASGGTTLRVTSPGNAAPGVYAFSVASSSVVGAIHARGATANYTVAAPVILLQTALSTDQATYARRSTVQIAAQVRNNGASLAGVVVTFTLVRPGGASTTLTATSGSDGVARTSYKVPNTKTALGPYTVTARWSFSGITATPVSTTFTVQ